MVSKAWAAVLCVSLLASTTWAASWKALADVSGEKPPEMAAAPPASNSAEMELPRTERSADRSGEPASGQAGDEVRPLVAEKLTPEEESAMSTRSEIPGPEVVGGALSNLHLTYAVIALAAIVLVLLVK